MTSEIVIMNREAVAVAADSAITASHESGDKIFSSANKIFTLSKYRPIGIMVFGSANFMDVPWETVIKIHRKELGDKKFNELSEYADNFIEFLDDGNKLFSKKNQKSYFVTSVRSYFHVTILQNDILKKCGKIIEEKGGMSEDEIKDITNKVINDHYNLWNNSEMIETISKEFEEEILETFEKEIDKIINEIFQELPVEEKSKEKLKQISSFLFTRYTKKIKKSNISGVVFFGFGENDVFPSLAYYEMEGVVENKLKFKKTGQNKTSHDQRAIVYPFAQSEMVGRFMEGVDPEYRKIEESYLSKIFKEYGDGIVSHLNEKGFDIQSDKLKEKFSKISEKLLENHKEKLKVIREKYFINPITSVVSVLPKDELAEMAESLVNLTSFKRKVSLESETVGGPIDVAVVSKGDGFIWIKRKHYFDKELNPQFFENYYMEE